jgi:DNA (cytosine-5)-methyltransferase 1
MTGLSLGGPTYLSLFSGIGGLDLGLDRAGWTCVGQVEINPFSRAVLAEHWPEVPRHDDVRTAVGWWLGEPRPAVDAVVGGYPCQPESLAGKRRGTNDERWLWPAMARVVHAVRPRYVIGENVVGHRTRGLRFVLRDLERLGYTARAGIIRACEVGAPHPRARLFVLAHTAGGGRDPRCSEGPDRTQPTIGAQERHQPAGRYRWSTEPDVDRMAHGVSGRVDRLAALGNAVVPQVAEYIGRLILGGAWTDG